MPEVPTVQARFAELADALVGRDGVTLGPDRRGFGSGALQVEGRIFAMVARGRLVVKLPRERVTALLASGDGVAFDAGKGRPMKEWVALEERTGERWLELAREARAFVASAPERAR
jgi:TfoX/Sxy family transcriptional regulator of competence genes